MKRKSLGGYKTVRYTQGNMKYSKRKTSPKGFHLMYKQGKNYYFSRKKPRNWKE